MNSQNFPELKKSIRFQAEYQQDRFFKKNYLNLL